MTRPLPLQRMDVDWTLAKVDGEIGRARERLRWLEGEREQLLNVRAQIQEQIDAAELGMGQA